MSATDDVTLIPTARLRTRFGGVSHMWIERRLKDDPTFPKPVYITNRRFWRVADLVVWEHARVGAALRFAEEEAA